VSVETVETLDELYCMYFDLIGKEVERTDALLAADDLEEKKLLAHQAMHYSREASAIAKAIKEIEDFKE